MLMNGQNVTEIKGRIHRVLFAGVAVAIPAFLVIFVLYPLASVLVTSFYRQGAFDFSYFSQLMGGRHLHLFRNTLLITLSSTFLAVLLGTMLSLAVHRCRFPFRRFFHYTAILNLISPPFVSAIVFIMLFGRRGLITNQLLGLHVSLVGPQMIVLLQMIGNASIAYLVISNVLTGLDRSLEQSAMDLGASPRRVFFTITLPLLVPGLAAAASLAFANILADFGTPILVGGGYRVLASEAYIQILSNYNLGYAATISVVLLFLSVWAFGMEKWFLRQKLYYSTHVANVTEKVKGPATANHRQMPFSPLVLGVATLFSLMVVIQFIAVIAGAFTSVWGYDYTLSLRHFQRAGSQLFSSLNNSLYFAFRVALWGPLLGITTAYFHHHSQKTWKSLLNFLAMVPFAVPGTVMGISYVMAFHRPPLALTGTAIIIVLICIVRELPISYNSAKAVLQQVASNLEEASRDLGASSWTTFTRIILPILAPAYRAGMFHGFIHVMITIGAIIFLITPRYVTITFEIFRAVNSGRLGEGAAYAFLLTVFTALGLLILTTLCALPGFLKKLVSRKDEKR
ncbi:iron(III) transport system permease protein [Tindallia californiensis]|uniref:Iron(III) transport system permease protein n=2 Tax=Tindallia californiensis TaxID=159292 RepID=A0A1H3PWB3_9FIRM|nr:iron(III) transport system permease protein [Tindallia californiensis]